ncbi:microcephalin isoform X2 [Rhodnius prolixus]|uniref:microcephalin isoform X2 n=1 Tax=Rhodnius prolixus TaxID=13249 RepID=UPI003D189113
MVSVDTESLNPANTLFSALTPKATVSLPSSLNKCSGNITETKSVKNIMDTLSSRNATDCISNGKSFIDHIFEKFDDIHVPYSRNNQKSPSMEGTRERFSNLSDCTPPFSSPEKFLTQETKSGRKLAAVEGRRDFCEILEHAGINSSTYLAGIFSSKKKKKPTFGSSTPLHHTTPFNKSLRINTPLPLSEIRFLTSPLSMSNNSDKDTNLPVTPVSKWLFTSNYKNLSISENVKTILLGIICYVDVRTEKENHSEICKQELLAIGAKVEKNFTKKVTHVIFKEGRMSTYIRAKKFGIPIVSVVWIEACKLANGPVDPALYPPTKMEKYEEETPFSLMMEKKGSSLRLSPVVRKSDKRKAVTELKECRASKDLINKERQCTKKLNFIDIEVPKDSEQQDIMKLDVSLSGNGNLSDSSLLEQLKLQSLPKRKSAPGALAKKKNDKQKNLNYYFQKENISRKRERSISPDNDLKTSEELTKRLQSDCNKLNEENTVNFTPITQNKKRKLFNPSESHLSKDFPLQNVQCSYPYPESPPTVKKNEVRSTRKKEFSALPSKSDDDSSTEDSQEQRRKDVLDIAMPRNSLSLFIINNKERNTSNKVKLTPTIVFTSVGSSDFTKLSLIVKRLGIFKIEERVSEKTTHVVTDNMRRTLNLLRGLARGCWIVRTDWILKSDLATKWLAEEHFEQKSFFPAVTKSRLERQAFKNAFVMDLFSTCGPIYVSQNSSPPTQDLIELIKLCCGKIVSCARGAKIIVGDKTASDRSTIKVREKWVLDSICNYKLMDTNKYVNIKKT